MTNQDKSGAAKPAEAEEKARLERAAENWINEHNLPDQYIYEIPGIDGTSLRSVMVGFTLSELEAANRPAIPPVTAPIWRCFHCEFETSDRAVAAAHFGDRDDPEEFKPICKWWERLNEDERIETLQDALQRTNEEQEHSAELVAELEAANKRIAELEALLIH